MKEARRRRIAVVTEGPTDFLVLRSILSKLLPGAEIAPIHPEVPLGSYPEFRSALGGGPLGAGWRGVRAWCQEYGGDDLPLFLAAVVGQEYDALVVHVDASMAHNLGIKDEPCPPASATTDLLRQVVLRDWLVLEEKPSFLFLATPSKTTDAWVLAACSTDLPDIECDLSVERLLAKRFKFRVREGEIKKSRARYEPLAESVGKHLAQVRRTCFEAERFACEVISYGESA